MNNHVFVADFEEYVLESNEETAEQKQKKTLPAFILGTLLLRPILFYFNLAF